MNNEHEGDWSQEEVSRSEDRVRVRYRFGDKEMEVEGSPEYVNRHAAMFLAQMAQAGSTSQYNGRNLLTEKDAPMLGQSTGTSEQIGGDEEPQDLISFFRNKAPKNQPDQVLVITYFYQKYKGYEHLSLEDYAEAFGSLRRLAVGMPNNMKSSVRNVVDRTKYLYNPERGRFALTIQGEQFVETLGENDDQQ